MTQHGLISLAAISTLLIATGGCSDGTSSHSRLLAPFAGAWTCDTDKTLDALQATGTPEEEISRLRALYRERPQFGGMHPDLDFSSDLAVSSGVPSAEYRFFGMHEHGGKVCGKAWHHEDRHDPGDMSKCYVRLSMRDGFLHMEVRMQESLPDLDDPDLQSPPTEGGSAADCVADDPPGADRGEWTTYVFARKG